MSCFRVFGSHYILIFHVEDELWLWSFESALKLSGLRQIIISLFSVICRRNKPLLQYAYNIALCEFVQSLLERKSNKYYIFWVCVCSTQCACTILSSVACLDVPYLFTLPHKRHDFWKKIIEYKMCVLVVCTTFFWNICYCNKKLGRYYHECVLVLT